MPSTTAELLPSIELETGGQPRCAVIWMHGLGADGNDFVPIVKELGLPADLAVRFVFPHAPMRPVSINQGRVMRAWHDYDAGQAGAGLRVDQTSLHASQRAIEALVERERHRGIGAERIVLAGFSQGGAMALQAGLHHSGPLAGILALSCYLPSPPPPPVGEGSRIQVFMAHGTLDNVVPPTAGRAARQSLLERGHAVEWHEYPMGHAVCMDEIADIGDWLARVLVPRGDG